MRERSMTPRFRRIVIARGIGSGAASFLFVVASRVRDDDRRRCEIVSCASRPIRIETIPAVAALVVYDVASMTHE